MSSIHQLNLFDLDILATLDMQERHAEIFSPLLFHRLVGLFQKETTIGAPLTVNYEAAIRAILSRNV